MFLSFQAMLLSILHMFLQFSLIHANTLLQFPGFRRNAFQTYLYCLLTIRQAQFYISLLVAEGTRYISHWPCIRYPTPFNTWEELVNHFMSSINPLPDNFDFYHEVEHMEMVMSMPRMTEVDSEF